MAEEITKEEVKRLFRNPNAYYEKGKKEGIELGIEHGIEKIITNMLQKELPDELIAEVSGVGMEKIKKLKRRICG